MFRISKSSVIYLDNASRLLTGGGEDAPEGQEPFPQDASPAQAESPRQTAAEKLAEAERQAQALLEKAREEAKAAVAVAEQNALQTRIEAQTEVDRQKLAGWQAGYQDGMDNAKTEAAALRAAQIADFESAGARFTAAWEQMIREMEKDVLRLVLDVARKIIQMELDMNDSIYASMVRHALNKMKSEGKITVRVSPSEYGRFFSDGAARFKIAGETVTVAVVEDQTLQRGDLIVESEGESINAGVETQLDAIGEAFDREWVENGHESV